MSVFMESVAVTLLFHKFFPTSPSLKTALVIALGAGTFSISYSAFTVVAKFVISPISTYVMMELIFGLIHYVAIGLVFYLLYKKPRVFS